MSTASSGPGKTACIEIRDRVGYVILDRPDRLNAINNDMVEDVSDCLDQLEADDEVRVIVVKGNGRAFSVGYDLKMTPEERKQLFPSDHAAWEWIKWQCDKWARLWRISKPTIAQVHGYAYAGGVSVMGNCDLIVAARNSLIGQPEVRAQGFAPETGLWQYTIGPRRTKELLFTGRAVTGAEALELGMINYAVPSADLDEFTWELADRMSNQSSDMLAYAKALVNQMYDIQGLQATIMTGINFDALAKHSDANSTFRQNAAEHGLATALEMRDAPFGGVQRIVEDD